MFDVKIMIREKFANRRAPAIVGYYNHRVEASLAAVRGMSGSAPSLPVKVLKSGAG
jgi:hypothetical protein